MEKKKTGNLGEKIAENYLKKKGYQILDKNYSLRTLGNPQKGEVDLIVKNSGIISFVEVKTLRQAQDRPFLPEDKVNFQKRRKIIKTAESWLMKNKIPLNAKWQIDVISLSLDFNEGKAKIRHFKNILC